MSTITLKLGTKNTGPKRFRIRKCESDPNRFWQVWNWVPCSAPLLILTPHLIFSQITSIAICKGGEDNEIGCSTNKERHRNIGKFPCGISQTLTAMEIGDLLQQLWVQLLLHGLWESHIGTFFCQFHEWWLPKKGIPWNSTKKAQLSTCHQWVSLGHRGRDLEEQTRLHK